MPTHAHGNIPMPKVVPHTTVRAKKKRVRVRFPGVADLLLTTAEAYSLADQLVDIAELVDTPETPSSP